MLRSWGFRGADVTRASHADGRLEPAREPRLPGRGSLPAEGERRRDGAPRHRRIRGCRRPRCRRRSLLVLVLYSESLARDLGDAVANFVSWTLARIFGRGRSPGAAPSFARFREEAVDLLAPSLAPAHPHDVRRQPHRLPAPRCSACARSAWRRPRCRSWRRSRRGPRPDHRHDPDHARRGLGVIELGFTTALVALRRPRTRASSPQSSSIGSSPWCRPLCSGGSRRSPGARTGPFPRSPSAASHNDAVSCQTL